MREQVITKLKTRTYIIDKTISIQAFINDVKPDKISTNYDYSDDIEISSTMNNIINDLMV